MRDQKEVDRVERGARAEVEDDDVGIGAAKLFEQAQLLGVVRVGGADVVERTRDEAQVCIGRVDSDIVEPRLAADDVAEGHERCGDSKDGVGVGAAEVGIHEQDPLSLVGQRQGEMGGDKGLADPAFASTDGDNAPGPHLGHG